MGAFESSDDETDKNEWDIIDDENWCSLLVCGFIRESDTKWELNIPKDVHETIYKFYDRINIRRQFMHYNPKHFQVSNEQTIITPLGFDFYNYMVYPAPNGFTKGIHKWSVQFIKHNGYPYDYCISIGVTSVFTKIKHEEWISKGVGQYTPWAKYGPSYVKSSSYYDGWSVNDTITIELNMDKGTVEYFNGDKKLKTDKIHKAAAPFYFAICINSNKHCGVFKSVLLQNSH